MTAVRAIAISVTGCVIACGCRSSFDNTRDQRNALDTMETATITIGDQSFRVWVARTDAQRNAGLMHVEAAEMQPLHDGTERGMLFIFERERNLSFWMKDTIIPLDIAYARSDGTIVRTLTMTPLDESTYPAGRPARFALEVNAGLFAKKAIREGDVMVIPDSVLDSGN